MWYFISRGNFHHIDEIELRWKKYKSEYNYDYYYNSNERVLILEHCYEDDECSDYTLINHKGEKYLWEWPIWEFEKNKWCWDFYVYNTDLWR